MWIHSAMLHCITPSPDLLVNSNGTCSAAGVGINEVPVWWHEGREMGCVLMQDIASFTVQVNGNLLIIFVNLLATILAYVGVQLVIKALSLKMTNLMLAFLSGL